MVMTVSAPGRKGCIASSYGHCLWSVACEAHALRPSLDSTDVKVEDLTSWIRRPVGIHVRSHKARTAAKLRLKNVKTVVRKASVDQQTREFSEHNHTSHVSTGADCSTLSLPIAPTNKAPASSSSPGYAFQHRRESLKTAGHLYQPVESEELVSGDILFLQGATLGKGYRCDDARDKYSDELRLPVRPPLESAAG